MYMLRISGQTAGPKFFVDTHGWPGGVIYAKKSINFFSHFCSTGNVGLQLDFYKRHLTVKKYKQRISTFK